MVFKKFLKKKYFILSGVTGLCLILIGSSIQFFDIDKEKNLSEKLISYSNFMGHVKNGSIQRILISADDGSATIFFENGTKKNVYLLPDKNLLKILTENDVDIAVKPQVIENPITSNIGVFIIIIGFLLVLFFIIFIPNLIN